MADIALMKLEQRVMDLEAEWDRLMSKQQRKKEEDGDQGRQHSEGKGNRSMSDGLHTDWH